MIDPYMYNADRRFTTGFVSGGMLKAQDISKTFIIRDCATHGVTLNENPIGGEFACKIPLVISHWGAN